MHVSTWGFWFEDIGVRPGMGLRMVSHIAEVFCHGAVYGLSLMEVYGLWIFLLTGLVVSWDFGGCGNVKGG